jgi:hypothetical protein
MSNRFFLVSISVASSVAFSLPQAASAQQIDIDAEYKAALAARDAGDYATACPKLAEIVQLRTKGTTDPSKGLGAQLELAACYERQGKLASAVEQYKLVQSRASAAGKKDREETAREKLATLQPRLAQLTILVPADVASLPAVSISFDQKALDKNDWGKPVPVDPGSHVVTVTAEGRTIWEGTSEIRENGERVSVAVQSRAPGSGAPSASGTPSVISTTTAVSPAAPATGPNKGVLIAGGALILGAIATGAGLLVASQDKSAEAARLREALDAKYDVRQPCMSKAAAKECQAVVDVLKARIALGNAGASVLIGAGVVAAATAGYWLVTRSRHVEVTPAVAPGTAGLVVRGEW